MKTLDLTGKRVTLDELLKLAAMEAVRILTADGRGFILEQADDFEKEVGLARQEQDVQALSQRTLQGSHDHLVRGLSTVARLMCRSSRP